MLLTPLWKTLLQSAYLRSSRTALESLGCHPESRLPALVSLLSLHLSLLLLTTTVPSNSTLMSIDALSSLMTSMSTSSTTSVASGVEPTTTTITHFTVTRPITVWYTPPVQIGTGSSGLPSSLSETSAPYHFSNQTSLVGPTGTDPSSSSFGTSPLTPVARRYFFNTRHSRCNRPLSCCQDTCALPHFQCQFGY